MIWGQQTLAPITSTFPPPPTMNAGIVKILLFHYLVIKIVFINIGTTLAMTNTKMSIKSIVIARI